MMVLGQGGGMPGGGMPGGGMPRAADAPPVAEGGASDWLMGLWQLKTGR